MFGTRVNTDKFLIKELLSRRIGKHEGRPNIWPSFEEAEKKLKEGKKIRVYLGIDPTGPDLHLGHTIPLLFLKQLHKLGHEPVLVIGDFTAKIGDPSGKSGTRKPLGEREIENNLKTYLHQVHKIIPAEYLKDYRNSSWLSKLSLSKFMVIASKISMHYMATRSMFQERLEAGEQEKPFAVHEFLYPLLQGYDSVEMKIDGEVGGSDQTFNMLIGRDLEKKLLNKDKLVFATRLLVDETSGKKMSKSEGNLIALTDEPREIRRKILAVDDAMLRTIAELCTEKPYEWIDERQSKGQLPKNSRAFKEEIADELVRMYHGENAVIESRKPIETESGSKIVSSIAGVIPEMSKSEIKSLLDRGAVEINDRVVKDWNYVVKTGDKVKVGKGKFIEVK